MLCRGLSRDIHKVQSNMFISKKTLMWHRLSILVLVLALVTTRFELTRMHSSLDTVHRSLVLLAAQSFHNLHLLNDLQNRHCFVDDEYGICYDGSLHDVQYQETHFLAVPVLSEHPED